MVKKIKRRSKKIKQSSKTDTQEITSYDAFKKGHDRVEQRLKRKMMSEVLSFAKSLENRYKKQFSLDDETQRNINAFLKTKTGSYFKDRKCDYDVLDDVVRNMQSLEKASQSILNSNDKNELSDASKSATDLVNSINNITDALTSDKQRCKETKMPLFDSFKQTRDLVTQQYSRFTDEMNKVLSDLEMINKQMSEEPELLKKRIAKLQAESDQRMKLLEKKLSDGTTALGILQKIEPEYNNFVRFQESAEEYKALFSYIKKYGANIFGIAQEITDRSRKEILGDEVQRLLDKNRMNQTMMALDGLEDDDEEDGEEIEKIDEQNHEQEENEDSGQENEEDEKEIKIEGNNNDDNAKDDDE
ncbi:MAG: hypothetical protein IJU54_00625 [Alphaproteobacteria bacterium]|nr:hypothetical protein [Alphaproteobacteria bacterium]